MFILYHMFLHNHKMEDGPAILLYIIPNIIIRLLSYNHNLSQIHGCHGDSNNLTTRHLNCSWALN